MALKDNVPMQVKCPKCGKVTTSTAGAVSRNPVVACSCGARITVTGGKGITKSVDQLENALKKIRKK